MTHPGNHRSNVLWRQLLKHLFRYDSFCHPWGSHGNYHIGVYVVLSSLLAQSAWQTNQTKLSRAVVGLAKVAIESSHWTCQYDSAITLFPKMRPSCLQRLTNHNFGFFTNHNFGILTNQNLPAQSRMSLSNVWHGYCPSLEVRCEQRFCLSGFQHWQ